MFLPATRDRLLWLVFLSVPSAQAADPVQMVDGVPLVHWKDADRYYGKEVIVYGRVVQTRNIQTMAFLNFDPDFSKHFTVVVKQADFDAFPEPPEKMYRDKSVAVRGVVVEYREKPEMVIKSPKQIVILPEDGGDVVAALRGNVPSGAPGGVGREAVGSPSTSAGQFTIAEVNLTALLAANRGFCDSGADASAGTFTQAAEALKTFNADVVAIQWGANLACLKRFNERLISDLGYSHVIGYENSAGVADCALLSRHPVGASNSPAHFTRSKDETVTFRRAPLRADLQLPSNEIVQLVVINLPVKDSDVKAAERSAEARGVGQLIGEMSLQRADAPLIVCGGFGGNIDSGVVTSLLENSKGLKVPGYAGSSGKLGDRPAITQAENFILASEALQARYTAGSTRVIQNDAMQSAVAVTFQMRSAEAPKPQTDQPASGKPAKDDF